MNFFLYKTQTALLLAGASCGLAIQLLVNLVSSAKYVCSDNSEPLIIGLKAIEWVVVFGACGTTLLALTHYQVTEKKRTSQANDQATLFYGCLLNLFVVFLALMTYTILHFTSGCSSCITQDSVDLAMRGTEDATSPDIAGFIMETSKMTGADNTGTYIDNYLTPEWFQIPNNYCRTTLQSIPGSVNTYTSSHAERCLVYNCTNLVPGSSAQEGIFYAACSLELVACCLIALQNMEQNNQFQKMSLSSSNSGKGKSTTDPTASYFSSFRRAGNLYF